MATIFYFTGTGNSLSMARGIAEKLNANLISIVDAMDGEKQYEDEVIGIVVPVYCMDIPNIVKEFLKKCKFLNNNYIFTVVTCGAEDGIALYSIKEILESKGLKLSYGYKSILPDNSIAFPTNEEKKNKMINDQCKYITKISLEIDKRVVNADNFKKSIKKYALKTVLERGLNLIYKINNKTIDYEKCINCGICERVCPVSNIHKQENKYFIEKNCENCFACAQWCPKRAISMGRLIPNDKTQYTHPDITVKDIMNQKSKSYS